jgi:hypothetical protein
MMTAHASEIRNPKSQIQNRNARQGITTTREAGRQEMSLSEFLDEIETVLAERDLP